MRTVRSHEFAI